MITPIDILSAIAGALSPILDSLLIIRSIITDLFMSILPSLQSISAVISAVLMFGIIWLVAKLDLLGNKFEEIKTNVTAGQFPKHRSVKVWQQIKKRMQAGDEANLKMAIIDADKILDDLLKFSGYKGETMADRLKMITPAQVSRIEGIWRGHKIRNRIAHEPDFHINKSEVEEVIEVYRKTFEEMGLLD